MSFSLSSNEFELEPPQLGIPDIILDYHYDNVYRSSMTISSNRIIYFVGLMVGPEIATILGLKRAEDEVHNLYILEEPINVVGCWGNGAVPIAPISRIISALRVLPGKFKKKAWIRHSFNELNLNGCSFKLVFPRKFKVISVDSLPLHSLLAENRLFGKFYGTNASFNTAGYKLLSKRQALVPMLSRADRRSLCQRVMNAIDIEMKKADVVAPAIMGAVGFLLFGEEFGLNPFDFMLTSDSLYELIKHCFAYGLSMFVKYIASHDELWKLVYNEKRQALKDELQQYLVSSELFNDLILNHLFVDDPYPRNILLLSIHSFLTNRCGPDFSYRILGSMLRQYAEQANYQFITDDRDLLISCLRALFYSIRFELSANFVDQAFGSRFHRTFIMFSREWDFILRNKGVFNAIGLGNSKTLGFWLSKFSVVYFTFRLENDPEKTVNSLKVLFKQHGCKLEPALVDLVEYHLFVSRYMNRFASNGQYQDATHQVTNLSKFLLSQHTFQTPINSPIRALCILSHFGYFRQFGLLVATIDFEHVNWTKTITDKYMFAAVVAGNCHYSFFHLITSHTFTEHDLINDVLPIVKPDKIDQVKLYVEAYLSARLALTHFDESGRLTVSWDIPDKTLTLSFPDILFCFRMFLFVKFGLAFDETWINDDLPENDDVAMDEYEIIINFIYNRCRQLHPEVHAPQLYISIPKLAQQISTL